MTLKIFLENLNQFVSDNPEALDLNVVTSKDDEGNGFYDVVYTPSKGYFDGEDFTPHTQLDDHDLDDSSINAVCVN